MLTVLQGEVDLYVSATYDKKPVYSASEHKVTSYRYASTEVGADSLLLTHDMIQDLCKDREACYIVIACYGATANTNGGVSSRYSLLVSTKDSTISLANGVPRRSSVAQGRTQYFKFVLTIANYDLVISVTPYSGDPGRRR